MKETIVFPIGWKMNVGNVPPELELLFPFFVLSDTVFPDPPILPPTEARAVIMVWSVV